jgi:hypothetical protein
MEKVRAVKAAPLHLSSRPALGDDQRGKVTLSYLVVAVAKVREVVAVWAQLRFCVLGIPNRLVILGCSNEASAVSTNNGGEPLSMARVPFAHGRHVRGWWRHRSGIRRAERSLLISLQKASPKRNGRDVPPTTISAQTTSQSPGARCFCVPQQKEAP